MQANFIVIAFAGSNPPSECRILPACADHPDSMAQVFGPAALRDCRRFLAKTCEGDSRPGVSRGQEANLFELRSGEINITCAATSLSGTPLLTVQGLTTANEKGEYQGDEIRISETDIGTMVTVSLLVVRSGDIRTLTLFLPQIIVPEGASESNVSALGVTTDHVGPDSVGQRAQMEAYREVYTFEGQAKVVTP